MSDGDALLKAILAHPDEDTPRLVYADWLDENDQPARAEFIRVQVELARLPGCGHKDGTKWCSRCGTKLAHVITLTRRERELMSDPNLYTWFSGPEWAGCMFITQEVKPFSLNDPPFAVVHRGFVESVTCTAEDWLAHADAITAAHPVREVTLTTWMGWVLTRSGASIYASGPDNSWRFLRDKPPPRAFMMSSSEYLQLLLAAEWPGIKFNADESDGAQTYNYSSAYHDLLSSSGD